MLRCPIEQIERYLPVPPDRPGIAHRGFVSGLSEQGIETDAAQLAGLVSRQFECSFGETS
jgi:hypothetical protein